MGFDSGVFYNVLEGGTWCTINAMTSDINSYRDTATPLEIGKKASDAIDKGLDSFNDSHDGRFPASKTEWHQCFEEALSKAFDAVEFVEDTHPYGRIY